MRQHFLTDPWAPHPVVNRKTVCEGGDGGFLSFLNPVIDVLSAAAAPFTGGASLAIPFAATGIEDVATNNFNNLPLQLAGDAVGAITGGAGDALSGAAGAAADTGFGFADLSGALGGVGPGGDVGATLSGLAGAGGDALASAGPSIGGLAAIEEPGGGFSSGVPVPSFDPANTISGMTSVPGNVGAAPTMPSVASPAGISGFPSATPAGGGGASAFLAANSPGGAIDPSMGFGDGISSLGSGGTGDQSGPGMIDPVTGQPIAPPSSSAPAVAPRTMSDFDTTGGIGAPGTQIAQAAPGAGSTTASAGVTPQGADPLMGGYTGDTTGFGGNPNVYPGGNTPPTSSGGWLGGLKGFLKDNAGLISLGTGAAGIGKAIYDNIATNRTDGLAALEGYVRQAQMNAAAFQNQYSQLANQALGLIQAGSNGYVNPNQYANLLATANRMKAQISARYAATDPGAKTNLQQDLNNVDLLIAGLQGSMAAQTMNAGVALANAATGQGALGPGGSVQPISSLVNLQTGSGKELTDALSGFASAAAKGP